MRRRCTSKPVQAETEQSKRKSLPILAQAGRSGLEVRRVLADAPAGDVVRPLLRLKPAAQYLSMSPGKLRALIQTREIPIVKYGENAPWLIDVRDLDLDGGTGLLCGEEDELEAVAPYQKEKSLRRWPLSGSCYSGAGSWVCETLVNRLS